MSAPALAPRPASRPGAARPTRPAAARASARVVAPAPRMRVVERPDLAPRRIGFAVSCSVLLGVLMLGLLLLNVAISGNAFTVADLRSDRGLLVDRQQALEQQLLVEAAPATLAARARALGMVPAPQTIVLAPDGSGAPPPPPPP